MDSNINEIKHKLNEEQYNFFNSLSQYINNPLYFYGSIIRKDYISGKSDIDIVIFTDNEISVIYTLCDFLNMSKPDFKKVIYKIKSNMIYGYKGNYTDENKNIKIEISIYNNKYKDYILEDYKRGEQLPVFINLLLFIIKILYYHLGLLSIETYKKCKKYLMDPQNNCQFMLMEYAKIYT